MALDGLKPEKRGSLKDLSSPKGQEGVVGEESIDKAYAMAKIEDDFREKTAEIKNYLKDPEGAEQATRAKLTAELTSDLLSALEGSEQAQSFKAYGPREKDLLEAVEGIGSIEAPVAQEHISSYVEHSMQRSGNRAIIRRLEQDGFTPEDMDRLANLAGELEGVRFDAQKGLGENVAGMSNSKLLFAQIKWQIMGEIYGRIPTMKSGYFWYGPANLRIGEDPKYYRALTEGRGAHIQAALRIIHDERAKRREQERAQSDEVLPAAA